MFVSPLGREFFKVGVEPVKAAMKLACLSRGNNMLGDTTALNPSEESRSETKQDAGKNSKVSAGADNFGIRAGAKLTFLYDESITRKS